MVRAGEAPIVPKSVRSRHGLRQNGLSRHPTVPRSVLYLNPYALENFSLQDLVQMVLP